MAEPGRRLDPTRLAEAAGRFPDAIVGEEVVRVGALEGHDLEVRLGLDRFDQVEDLVVHLIVDRVDRRMIDRHTPIARRLLLSGDPGRHVVHSVSFQRCPLEAWPPAFADPGACRGPGDWRSRSADRGHGLNQAS